MEAYDFLFAALLILTFATAAQFLQARTLTPPMVVVALGLTVGSYGFNIIPAEFQTDLPAIQAILKVTLIIVLFSDACGIRIKNLRQDHTITTRMLAIGIPLSVIIGMFLGVLLLPGFGFWDAALLAALLTCTDAALGEAILATPGIPEKERQILTLESGLNDGLVLPIILFLGICDSIWSGVEHAGYWIWFTILQFGAGITVGVGVGYLGYLFYKKVGDKKSINTIVAQYGGAAFALFAYGAAEWVHGNGFVAAFGARQCRQVFPCQMSDVQ